MRLAVAVPHGEIGQLRTVVIALDSLLAGRVRKPVRARKQSVKMVETPVLRIDDDYGLDLRKIGRGGGGASQGGEPNCAGQKATRTYGSTPTHQHEFCFPQSPPCRLTHIS